MTIHTLLIANRGEIACRIARTCRRLGVETIAVCSDADADALHVAACDRSVRLGGNAPADTYLRVDKLLDAAARTGADAVHPGYGFLAESAELAGAVLAAGLVWVGPPPAAIAAMGSKVEAKRLMREAGVPVLPDVALDDPGAEVDADAFPLLIKASAGGGGRGMRLVTESADLADAVAAARREALAAFGVGDVFAERYVERGRHIEIQVLGDDRGTVRALFERECSVQRRHQKIIEEAPSPFVGEELRAAMSEAAVAAATAVGYVGAGTVEFLVEESGRFHFLEMNTRLQVEHPVTEAITGLDLVELQLRIAEGEPLPPEAMAPTVTGHAVEARLTAEDPAAGYLPSVGRLVHFDVGRDAGVRVDTGFGPGSVVSPHYDSMIAKVIAHGPTREAAIRRLRTALADARIAGVTTNRDQLVNVLDHPDFLAGRVHTGFLDADPLATPRRVEPGVAGAVAWFADDAREAAAATVLSTIPRGWRNNRAVERRRAYRAGGDEVRLTDASLPVSLAAPVRVADGVAEVLVDRDGVVERYTVVVDGDRRWIDGREGQTVLDVVPRHPEPTADTAEGSLVATMPGAIRRILVARGDAVVAGQALVVIEAMKMEHQLTAPTDGTVEAVLVAEGDQVDTGAALVELS